MKQSVIFTNSCESPRFCFIYPPLYLLWGSSRTQEDSAKYTTNIYRGIYIVVLFPSRSPFHTTHFCWYWVEPQRRALETRNERAKSRKRRTHRGTKWTNIRPNMTTSETRLGKTRENCLWNRIQRRTLGRVVVEEFPCQCNILRFRRGTDVSPVPRRKCKTVKWTRR